MIASIHPLERSVETDILGAADEETLCRMLRRRTGIVLRDHQLESLRKTAHGACARFGYTRCADYVTALEWAPETSAEMEFLVAGITVAESYFFRDLEQIEFLRNTWLPQIVAAKRRSGERTLRVWSAGCAAGQEVYSLAMLIREALPDNENWIVHLLGTDINIETLSQALRGRYREWSLRATPDDMRQRYFSRRGDAYEISAELRVMARFDYLNLVADGFPSMLSGTTALDLILCRNVFIYFDREIARSVMNKFAACLVPGGHLLLGLSDPVDTAADALTQCRHGNVFYLRRDEQAPRTQPVKRRAPGPRPADRSAGPRPVGGRAKGGRQTAARVDATAAVSPPLASRRAGESQVGNYESIIDLLRRERWHEALDAVTARIAKDEASALLLQFKAKALGNLGKPAIALSLCQRSLALNATDKHTHLLNGLVLLELNRLPEAERALRAAIYLDREFVEVHFQLGLLQLRNRQHKSGLKSLGNALALAEAGDPERELHNATGMTYGRLAEILKNELGMYAADYAGVTR